MKTPTNKKGSFRASSKWLFMFIVLTMLLVCTMTACDACAEEPIPEGPETGVYYYDTALGEYVLTLNGGDNFTLAGPDVNKSGKYTVLEGTMTLDFVRDEDGTATATLGNGTVSLLYGGKTLNFIKKTMFNVSFNTNGGSTVAAVTVINGKTATKPNDPSKDDHVFLGWYADEALTKSFLFGQTAITKDTTVYAKWAATVPGQDEFVVDFDLGYEGGTMPAIATVGGKLVFDADYTVPTREGYTFVGWFASAYEDGAKLTYEVTENAVLKADTTLFAVWSANGTALQAPAVSIVGNNISWKDVKGAIAYDVTVKDAEGNVLFERSVGTTTQTYDFATAAAGDYVITVVAKGNGDATSEAATRYYLNKALDRVYRFEVVGENLIFNAVAHAEKYLVTVNCGNSQHNHTLLDNGLSTYFNFANCQMQPGGIAFTVTAVADGYASSTSETFCFVRNLDKVSNIVYDAATATFSWNSVANATKYYVTVSCGAHTHAVVDNGALTSICVKECEGDITVSVVPVGIGSNSPEATTVKATKTLPATPTNVTVDGMTVKWDAVEGAKSYAVKVNGTTYNTTELFYDLQEIGISFTLGSKHTVSVAAVGATEVSLASDVLEMTYLTLGDLSYAQNTVSWDPVLGMTRFDVRVNGGDITTVTANEAVVKLTRAGLNKIEVRPAGFATTAEWASIEVYAYEIVYETRSLNGSVKEYVAKGDKMSLPTGYTYAGFNFDGWYNAPAAAFGNGAQYTETVFVGNGDTTLYANWAPKSYTITFIGIDGTMSGAVNKDKATVTYTKDFKLPVMTTTDLIKSNFAGWYTGADGTGVKLTDYLGNSVAPYNVTGDVEAHPYFTSGLIFDLQNDGTYSVKKGNDINTIPVVTIPATYNGIAVTTILENAFYNCDFMVEVNIPDTIKLIGTGAFNSCDRLVSFNVYEVETETPHEVVYSSHDGALLYFDAASGYTYLEAFPRAKTGAYFVPETVDIIRNRAFNYSKITSLTISKEVKILGNYAFSNCRYLKDITFEEGSTTPISVANNAFYGCYSVTSIKLPALIKGSGEEEAFDITTLDGLTALEKIEVEAVTGAYFSAIEGMLCNDLGDTILYCPKAYTGISGVLTIPKGVTNIGDGTFRNRNVFTAIVIPNYITNIGKEAFYGCRNVEKITFEGLRTRDLTVGANAFYGCSGTREIIVKGSGSATLDAGVITFGETVFGGMSELRTLTVEAGANIAEIGAYAFASNLKLRNINVADDAVVSKIGEGAFKGCEALASFTIPASTTEIGDKAFADCAFLSKIIFAPNGQNIDFGSYVFQNCVALARVELPATVQRFDGSAFDGCYSLKEIIVDPNNTFLTTKDGVLYSKDFSEIMFYPKGIDDPTLSKLPWDKLTVIGNTVFKDNVNLTSVVIPGRITVIGDSAFDGCVNLSSVTFETNGATLAVGNMAFANCPNLTAISLPSYTTKIGDGAFYITPLTAFTIPSSVTYIGDRAFMYTNLTEINIPASVATIGDGAFAYTDLATITFEGGTTPLVIGTKTDLSIDYGIETNNNDTNRAKAFPITYIGVQAYGVFTDTKLTAVELPARTTSIGAFAFYAITGLKTVTLPQNSNLTTIGDAAFYGSGLTAMNLENTKLAVVGEYAFTESKLVSAKFPNTIARIERYAFSDVGTVSGKTFTSTLTEVQFATGGTTQLEIHQQAFRNSAFTTITFPKNLTFCSEEIMVVSTDPTYGVRMPSFYRIFEGNYKLAEVNVEAGCELYASHEGVFYFQTNGELTHLVFCPPAKTGSYTVPNTVTKVAHRAFWLSQLTSVTFAELPETDAGYGKPSLEIGNAATVTTNAQYPVFGGKISGSSSSTKTAASLYYSSSTGSLVKTDVRNSNYLKASTITEINFPSHLGLIASYGIMQLDTAGLEINFNMEANDVCFNSVAIYNNQGLTELHLPRAKSLSQRGDWQDCTFAYNKNMTTITFAEGSTFTVLPHRCFDGNAAMTTFEVPANVTLIEQQCFQNCKKLASVTFAPNSKLEEIDHQAFAYTGLTEFTIPDTVTTLGYSLFNNTKKLTKVTLGLKTESIIANDLNGNITTILRGATAIQEIAVSPSHATLMVEDGVLYDLNKTIVYYFPIAKAPGDYTVPDTVRTIAPYAFEKYSGTTMVLPEGLTHIQIGAFFDAKFASVTIPSTVVEIANTAFYRNHDNLTLKSVTIPQNSQLTSIGRQAFYYGQFSEIYLPDSIETIGDSCFAQSTLKRIVLPAALKQINHSTFANCKQLESVVMQGNLEIIDIQAFYECDALTELTIPASVHTINYYAFRQSDKLAHVYFEEGSRLSTVGYMAFMDCPSLVSIVFPEGVTSIGERQFSGCASLTYVDMSKTTFTELISTLSGDEWWGFFDGCYALETVLLPETLEVIDTNCFRGLINLKEIHIPSSVNTLRDGAFDGCTSLAKVTFGQDSTLTALGAASFRNTHALTEIKLPVYLQTMGDNIFENSGLTTIEFPETLTAISKGAFKGCEGLTSVSIPANIMDIEDEAFMNCVNVETLTMAEGVEYLGGSAFGNCGKIADITVPATVARMGGNPFADCVGVRNFSLALGNESFMLDRLGVLYDINARTVIFYPPYLTEETYELPSTVYEIASSAFAGSQLTSFVIPDTIKVVPAGCFKGSAKLKTVTIPLSVLSIEAEAFMGCSSLNNVKIPSSCTYIGDSAFENCSTLTAFDFGTRNTSLNVGIALFRGCTSFSEVILPDGLTAIPDYMFANTGVVELVIPESVTDMSGTGLFMDCAKLVSVQFPEDLTGYIGAKAFYNCTALTSVVIPAGVSALGDRDWETEDATFKNCTALVDVTLGESMGTLGVSAFENCTSLRSIDMSGCYDMWEISSYAFRNCTALETVIFSESSYDIYQNAFENCTALTGEIHMPYVWFYGGFFKGCTSITALHIYGFDSIENYDPVTQTNTNGNFAGWTAEQTIYFDEMNWEDLFYGYFYIDDDYWYDYFPFIDCAARVFDCEGNEIFYDAEEHIFTKVVSADGEVLYEYEG